MFFLLISLGLFEQLSDRPKRYSILHALLYDGLPRPLIHLSLLILVTLHSVCLARPGLSVGEDGCMETVHDLSDESLDLQLVEDFLLTVLRINDLVEFESFPDDLRRILLGVLFHTRNYDNITLKYT